MVWCFVIMWYSFVFDWILDYNWFIWIFSLEYVICLRLVCVVVGEDCEVRMMIRLEFVWVDLDNGMFSWWIVMWDSDNWE